MQESKPRILIISSIDPTVGPGVLAEDTYLAFKRQGYKVDVLTLSKCQKYPEFIYIKNNSSIKAKIQRRIVKYFGKVRSFIRINLFRKPAYPKKGHDFSYFRDVDPPVPVTDILSKINDNYDIVYVLFWWRMLSFATILEIYRKLSCYMIFAAVDYAHMSGGCHFTGNCERYMVGCGCCPAFDSNDPNDFTRINVDFRKKAYDEIQPAVFGNSYMHSFYEKSFLLKGYPYKLSYPIIDLDLYKPMDKDNLHKRYGVPKDKSFKVLFGCQSIADVRKGMNYLIDALNIFGDGLTDEDRSHVLIIAVGKDFGAIKSKLHYFDTYEFGYVSKEELAPIYSFADVFLCSSVNDAGPMMVNQSLCCGTPVVGFEMGACLDAIKDKGTGYCAKLRDSQDFASCIDRVFRQTPEERDAMQKRCLEFARKTYSYEACVKRIIDVYNENKA